MIGSARAGRTAGFGATVGLLLVVVLVALGAGSPQKLLGGSRAPLTVASVERLVDWVAWVALVVLAVLLLAQSLSRWRWARSNVGERLVPLRPQVEFRDRPTSAPAAGFATAARLTLPRRHDEPTLRSSGFPVGDAGRSRAWAGSAAGGDAGVVASLEVLALGPLLIRRADRRVPIVRAATAELVAYLAFHREGASRDQLLEALWPGTDPRRGRQRLWQSVSEARRVFGPALGRERDRYRLDRSGMRIDLDLFDTLLGTTERARLGARQDLLEQAFALVRGGVLEGSDFAWAEGESRRLNARLVQLAEQVGRRRLEVADPAGALVAAERGLSVEPLDEALWRLAMEAEARLGLRQALTRRYESLRALLLERLGLEPERATRLLYRRLLAQPADEP